MPPVAIAAVGAAASYGIGVAIGTITYSAATLAATVALSAALAGASMLLAPDAQDFSSLAQDRNHTIRQPVAPRQILYGKVRTGGPIVFINVHGDLAPNGQPNGVNKNKWMNIVIPLANHEVDAIEDIYLNDEKLDLGADGYVNSGTYYYTGDWGTGTNAQNILWERGMVRVRKYLGAPGQVADQGLINETAHLPAEERWTAESIGNGVAYIVVTLEWNTKIFQSGIPNITAVVRGKKVYDPRTGTTAWSDNAALCIRDYLLTPHKDGGIGASASELLETNWVAQANLCDEAIPLAEGGTEKRYTCNGSIELSASNSPKNTMEALLTSCAGNLSYSGGQWRLLAGAYRTPTVTLTDNDFRGPVEIQTRASKRDSYNAVKGTFVSPANLWQPADYPAVLSDTAMAEDGGHRVFRELDMPFTHSAATAQRLAKLDLLKSRQPIVVSVPCKLTAFRCQVGDTVLVTRERQGWVAKPFEVVEWRLAVDAESGLGVDLVLKETAPEVYDFNTSEEQPFDPAPGTTLPDWRTVSEVQNLSVDSSNSQVIEGSDGGLISRALVTWTHTDNALVESFDIQWRPSGETAWSYSATTTSNAYSIDSLNVGVVIDVRVRARNSLGIYGNFTTVLNHQISGFSARPNPAVTGLKIQGSAAGTPGTFNTRDATFVWDATSLGPMLFSAYVVEIRDATTNALRRRVETINPIFTYSYDANTTDGIKRSFKISVQVRNRLGALSTATTLTASNPAPGAPTAVSLTGSFRTISMRYTPPTDPDYEGILLWVGTATGFARNAASLKYQGPDTFIVLDALPGTAYYVRYACFDAFGVDGIVESAESLVNTIRISHTDLVDDLIEESNLVPSLRTSIQKIPVLETAITNEQTLREDADESLAQQITTLSAVTGVGFNATVAYHFDATVEGWAATNGTLTWQSSGAVRQTATTADPYIQSPSGLAINGAQNRYIRARVTRIAGSGWDGTAYYTTSGHGHVTGYRKTIGNPTIAVGGSAVLTWDMHALTASTPNADDWKNSTITRIRLDLGSTTADQFDIEWVAIGAEAPAASTAMVQAETLARTTALESEATARQTLQTTVNGHTTSIQTQATSINGLEGQYTVKIDNNNHISGFGLASVPKDGATVSSFVINADKFALAKPSAGMTTPNIPFIIDTTETPPVLSFTGVMAADQLRTGTIDTETLYVGGTNLVLDGPSKTIKVKSGTTDVVKMGRLSTGPDVYGIEIKDPATGNLVLSSGAGLGNGVVKSANLASGQGVNWMYNSDAQLNTDGWYPSFSSAGIPLPTIGRNVDAGNTIPGTGLMYWFVPATYAANLVFDIANCGQNGNRYPVQAGQRYEASGYAGVWRAKGVEVFILWLNASGTGISESHGNQVLNQGGFVRLNQLGRTHIIAVAPVGAVSAQINFRVTTNGGTNPYGMVTQAYFGPATVNQSEVSPWVPGPNPVAAAGVAGLGALATVSSVDYNAHLTNKPQFGGFAYLNQINNANVSTYIASAAIGDAHIATLNAAKIRAGMIDALDINVRYGSINVIDSNNANRVRMKIGHVPGYAYGFYCYDNNGNVTFEASGARNYLNGAIIGNAEIGTLKLAGESVLIPRSASTTTFRTGNGGYQAVLQFPMVVPHATRLILMASTWLSFPNGPKNWKIRGQIYNNATGASVYQIDREGGAYNDAPAMSGDVQVGAGSYNCVLWWYGINADVKFHQANMIVLGAMR